MEKYVCSVCGFVYDEAKGIPDAGIAPGSRWEDLPEDWVCPICGATKAEFEKQGEWEKFLDSLLIELGGFDSSHKSINYYKLSHNMN